jgi:thioredoxin 1
MFISAVPVYKTFQQSVEKEKAIELTDKNFDKSTSKGLVMVDFWAPWCGPCRIQGPIIEQLAVEYKGRATIAKLNIDENPVISARFYIQSIPTIIVYKEGKAVERIVGLQNKQKLINILNKHLN